MNNAAIKCILNKCTFSGKFGNGSIDIFLKISENIRRYFQNIFAKSKIVR